MYYMSGAYGTRGGDQKRSLSVGNPEGRWVRKIVHRCDGDIQMDFKEMKHECMDWAIVSMVMNIQGL